MKYVYLTIGVVFAVAFYLMVCDMQYRLTHLTNCLEQLEFEVEGLYEVEEPWL